MEEPLIVILDKNKLEEKGKVKKAVEANKISLPITKIIIPSNLEMIILNTEKLIL